MARLTIKTAFDDYNHWYDGLTKRQVREIQKIYSDSLREVKKNLLFYFDKYGTDGKLDLKDMQKYNRLQGMYEELEKSLNELSKVQSKNLQSLLFDIYDEGYNRTGWVAEQAVGINLRWYRLNTTAIREAIQMPVSGLRLSDLLEKRRREIIWRIRQEVTQGLVRGESYFKTSSRLKEAFSGDYAKAVRVVWTESHRVKEQSHLAATDKLKEKHIRTIRRWVATLDGKTRDTHRDLDGQFEDEKGYFHIRGLKTRGPGLFGVAREDIHCRCTTILVFEGENPQTRMIQGQGISKYITYNEWKKKL